MDGALGTSTDRSLTNSFSMLNTACCASVMKVSSKENRSLKLRERDYFTRASPLPIAGGDEPGRSMNALRRQPAFERVGFHRAGGARRLNPVPEQDEAGNAADMVAHRHLRVRLGVDLGEAHARAHFGRHLLEDRRHH